ncbi:MAG: hypothetical protein OXF39_05845 [Nitrospira sp.]|nr:hypothetical protein [Nitrospira sp.]
MVQEPAPPPATVNTQSAFRGQGTGGTFPGAGRAFDAFDDDEPEFGSVVQSFGLGVSRVTGIDTTFTGDRFTLRLNRANGQSTVLDTNQDETLVLQEYTPATSPVTNRPAADGYVGRVNANGGIAAGVGVEWDNTDVTDYVAGGYWIYADVPTGAFEMGAFIDGPAFDDMAVQMPVTGTATYHGRAAGVYISQAGVDTLSPRGTFEQGEYGGRAQLTADFGRNQISGRIDQIEVGNINVLYPNGTTNFVTYADTDYVLTMNPVSIGTNGQFSGSSLTLTHPSLSITTSGSWGGRFSNVQDSQGSPRAVAGTHAAYILSAGGSEGLFTGAFYGATERFE